jgi:hypothetical protein
MKTQWMYWPAITLVMLTFAVWLRMFSTRIAQITREKIRLQSVATSAQAAARLTDSRAADNFRNLFELPVLFYLAVIVATQTAQVNLLTLALAWIFVVLRVVHSAIQCTYNKVIQRFYTYVAGGAALFLLWIALAIGLLE